MSQENRIINRNGINLDIAIHSHQNGKIIINYPGITSDIDGYNNKYGQLADFIQENKIGTVIRMGNKYFSNLPYPQGMIDNFKSVIDYSLKNSEELSGIDSPELYLMGFSAGASTIAAVSGYYSEIEKILLMAPSGDAGIENCSSGLKNFYGEVYVAIGDNDEIVGTNAGKIFYDLAINAKHRQLKIIPNCGHQFIGETNGKIMSKAPLWAFNGDKTFPNPKGGKKLY